jgi:hypothetical protein
MVVDTSEPLHSKLLNGTVISIQAHTLSGDSTKLNELQRSSHTLDSARTMNSLFVDAHEPLKLHLHDLDLNQPLSDVEKWITDNHSQHLENVLYENILKLNSPDSLVF